MAGATEEVMVEDPEDPEVDRAAMAEAPVVDKAVMVEAILVGTEAILVDMEDTAAAVALLVVTGGMADKAVVTDESMKAAMEAATEAVTEVVINSHHRLPMAITNTRLQEAHHRLTTRAPTTTRRHHSRLHRDWILMATRRSKGTEELTAQDHPHPRHRRSSVTEHRKVTLSSTPTVPVSVKLC